MSNTATEQPHSTLNKVRYACSRYLSIMSYISRLICWTLPLSLFNCFRLFLFVVSLSPGFFRFAWYYFVVSDRVSVRYADESIRQQIDVYRSCQRDIQHEGQREPLLDREGIGRGGEMTCRSNAPVLIFCTGGAWLIGYKMWGTLLARALTATGVVVVIPDMQNYPSVYIPDMVNDVDLAIDWTFKNIAEYGGDPTNIVLVGQSAGGHVAMMAVLKKIRRIQAENNIASATQESIGAERRGLEDDNLTGKWMPSDLKGFAVISSPLNLKAMTEGFRRHGFNDDTMDRMFGFEKDKYDPFLALQEILREEQIQILSNELPPIHIYHGTDDKTVPYEVSETFHQELSNHMTGENYVSFVSYSGWSHTDPILEGPMDADHRLHRDLFNDVKNWTDSSNLIWPDDPIMNDRLCPHFMIQIGRFFNPF